MTMDFSKLYTESLRALLVAAGDKGAASADRADAASRLVRMGTHGTAAWSALRKATQLQSPELDTFIQELVTFLRHDAIPSATRTTVQARNVELAMLRALSWFETMRSHDALKTAPDAGPSPADRTDAYRLVSALELMMRELMRQVHARDDAVRARLERLLPREAAEALRRRPHDPIGGLFLKDLARLYVDEPAWASLQPLYRPSPLLRLLDEQRTTAERFLEDLRRIRNNVAHFEQLSAVQHALLVHYHDELCAPVREAHARGETPVDPAGFDEQAAKLESAELRRYEREVLDEVRQEGRRTGRIARIGLAVSLAVLLGLALVLWPRLRIALDPDLAYTDALAADPRSHGTTAVRACELGRLQALARLAAAPGAANAMTGTDAPHLHHRIVRLATERSAQGAGRLAPCVAAFASMGWDPNRIGNRLSDIPGLDDAAGPATAGYRRFLQEHPGSLIPGRLAPPGELRCPVAVLAVWAGDTPLVSALRTAGADAGRPCLLDAFYGDGTRDLPLSSALDEARRLGDAHVAAALQSAPPPR